LHPRTILAATALAAALVVPTVASATDKQAGPGDKDVPAAWQNRDQSSGSNSQAVGGQGSNSAAVGQIGGAPSTVGQIGGSTPAATGGHGSTEQAVGGTTPTGQGGGDGTAPVESAIACAPVKGKAPKDDTNPSKSSKSDPHDKTPSSKVPKDDDATLEDELRERQEMMKRLTDILNETQQRIDDVTRSITSP
jgi:hypothetical protein